MSETTRTVEALGLIYTNVEAKESPTGQRGFQVWQASAGLSPEARKEISRRVDDYRLPAGTTPEAAATLTRDGYFALSAKAGGKVAGGFAVARSVPLNGKDKFGRGGRFLTHVLVVSVADFATLGHDPFALFDAATFYGGEPERLILDHPEWVKGVLPVTHLTPVSTPGECLPGPLRANVAGHIDRDPAQRKTVVVVGTPAEVAAELRRIYRGLPPALRALAEFDTLSAGASLTQVPCAFAGCPTEAALKMWPFRRFVRFHPVEGKFTPPSELQPPTSAIRGGLPGTKAWEEATDAARHTAWAAATAIEANDVADAATALEGDAASALAILEAVPQFNATLERWRREWFARCPAVVAAVPGVRQCLDDYLSGPLSDRLTRLRGDVPRPQLADILLHEFSVNNYGSDDPAALGHIQDWLGKDSGTGSAGRRLNWVLSRLRGRDLPDLGEVLTTGEDEHAVWFRDWFLRGAASRGITARKLCRELAHDLEDDELDPQQLYDAELYSLCQPNETLDELRDLRFRLACRNGGVAGLIEQRKLPELTDLLEYFRPRTILGWTVLADGTYFGGAFVYPRSEQDVRLLAAVPDLAVDGRQLLHILFPKTGGKFPAAPLKVRSVEGFFQDFVEKLKPSKGKRMDAATFQDMGRRLAAQGELCASESVGFLRDRLHGEPFVDVELGGPPYEAALFGVHWVWESGGRVPPQFENLLEIVLGTAAQPVDRQVFMPVEMRRLDPEKFARLLSWM